MIVFSLAVMRHVRIVAMASMQHSPNFQEHDSEAVEAWDRLAEWLDVKIGDPDEFQDDHIEPATERMLALKAGIQVFDIARSA
jgi:hypothetical protein